VCEVECGSRANSDRPLAKVVAGVVERMGMSVPRWAHPCRSDRSWGCVCRVVARRRSQEPVAFDKTCRSLVWFPRQLIHSDLISVVQRRRTGLPRFGSSTGNSPRTEVWRAQLLLDATPKCRQCHRREENRAARQRGPNRPSGDEIQNACFPCDEALMRWALTLALTMALGRKLALCGTATPPMRRLG